MRPISLGVLLMATALLMFGRPADAAGPGFCAEYVKEALKAAASNIANRCNFTGRRYSTSQAEQMRWCRENDEDTVSEDEGNRSKQTVGCEYCRKIQERAEATRRENIHFGCGFTGPGWDDSEQVFGPCYTAVMQYTYEGALIFQNPGADEAEVYQFSREVEIRECKRKYTPEQIAACEGYASRAVASTKTASDMKCATYGPRWSPNPDDHFQWCLATVNSSTGTRFITPPAERVELSREESIRNKRIEVCKLEANAGSPKRKVEKEMAAKKNKRLGKKKPGDSPTVAGTPPGTTKDDKAFGGRSTVRQDGPSAIDRLSNSPSGGALSGGQPRNPQPPPPPTASGGISTSTNSPSGGAGMSRTLGTNALDRGGMTMPRGLPAGSNSGTR
jgi:hypothetical protein